MESSPSAASADGGDVVLWGMTTAGRTFRPSDWAERLAGLTHVFGLSGRLTYSALVRPLTIKGVRAVIVGRELASLEPRLFNLLLGFARDNELLITRAPGAIVDPQSISPPAVPGSTQRRPAEPAEPV